MATAVDQNCENNDKAIEKLQMLRHRVGSGTENPSSSETIEDQIDSIIKMMKKPRREKTRNTTENKKLTLGAKVQLS